MRPTSAQRGQDVRDRLLEAAAALITELGWGGVTTRAVARRAYVNAGLVHYHFRSVSELLRQAALGVVREAVTAPMDLLREAPDVPTGLARLMAALDSYDGTDPISLLLIETYLAATRDTELHADFAALVGQFRRELAEWLQSHGERDAQATAAVLTAALDGLLLHRGLDPSLDAAAIGRVVERIVIGGSGCGR